jgi:hypothetical protein
MQLALKCIVFSFTFYLKQIKCSKKSTLFFKHWNKISLAGHKKLLGGPKRLAGRILCGNDVNNDNLLFLWNPKATASASVLRDEVSLFENLELRTIVWEAPPIFRKREEETQLSRGRGPAVQPAGASERHASQSWAISDCILQYREGIASFQVCRWF